MEPDELTIFFQHQERNTSDKSENISKHRSEVRVDAEAGFFWKGWLCIHDISTRSALFGLFNRVIVELENNTAI